MFKEVFHAVVQFVDNIVPGKKRLKNIFATFSQVKTATYKVRRDLRDLGLLFDGSRLSQVPVIYHYGLTKESYVGFGRAMGLYYFETKDIHIPAYWPAALLPKLSRWYHKRRLVDVIRHEFGHALEGKFKKYFHDSRFRKAFGASYGLPVAKDGDEQNYVSSYARTDTGEDFAETFMLYVKHKGVLPKQFVKSPAIRAKWKTVEAICKDIAKLKK